MIEVTDEMVEAAALAFTAKPTEATYVVARRMVEASLKVKTGRSWEVPA